MGWYPKLLAVVHRRSVLASSESDQHLYIYRRTIGDDRILGARNAAQSAGTWTWCISDHLLLAHGDNGRCRGPIVGMAAAA